MIRRIIAAMFPPRPFPEPDGILDAVLLDLMQAHDCEVRTAESLEVIGDYIVRTDKQENPK